MSEKQDSRLNYSQEWPDEFILKGGRIGCLMFPDIVFKRVRGDHPDRRSYAALLEPPYLTIRNIKYK